MIKLSAFLLFPYYVCKTAVPVDWNEVVCKKHETWNPNFDTWLQRKSTIHVYGLCLLLYYEPWLLCLLIEINMVNNSIFLLNVYKIWHFYVIQMRMQQIISSGTIFLCTQSVKINICITLPQCLTTKINWTNNTDP